MTKLAFAKTVFVAAVGFGASHVVENAVKKVTPPDETAGKALLTKLGMYGLGGAAMTAAGAAAAQDFDIAVAWLSKTFTK